ncbi:MAG: hypothetical protein PHP42_03150 [Bacteroidota bacterium]|nr:hypothetical protein [Bacteroidota bacterium]
MGTSKIAAISGVYIILGLYSLGFNSTDESTSKAAYETANTVQAEHIARAGLSMALVSMGGNQTVGSSASSLSMMGGTVTYTVSTPLPSSERQITSTATLNTSKVTVTAIVNYDKNRWRIERVFTQTTFL